MLRRIAAKALIVFDDKDHRIAAVDGVAVVDERFLRCFACRHGTHHLRRGTARRRLSGRHEIERQIEREGAASSRRAVHRELAAQQPGDFAADRKAKARAAIFAAGGAIGLLERLRR